MWLWWKDDDGDGEDDGGDEKQRNLLWFMAEGNSLIYDKFIGK